MRTTEQVDLELIDDNPWQPRQVIDPDALDELAESIHQLGLMQSPRGRRSPDVSGPHPDRVWPSPCRGLPAAVPARPWGTLYRHGRGRPHR